MGATEGLTFYVTPTLCLGDPPPFAHVVCTTAREALDVITTGHVALLPIGAWDLVCEVLYLLGMNDDEIDSRIHFSITGELDSL